MTRLDCGHTATPNRALSTGEARTPDGRTLCEECAFAHELETMQRTGKATLYMHGSDGRLLTDWPGTLRIRAWNVYKQTARPFGRTVTRTDFWFTFGGAVWHGFNAADGNTLVHCTRTKQTGYKLADEYPDPNNTARLARMQAEARTEKALANV